MDGVPVASAIYLSTKCMYMYMYVHRRDITPNDVTFSSDVINARVYLHVTILRDQEQPQWW